MINLYTIKWLSEIENKSIPTIRQRIKDNIYISVKIENSKTRYNKKEWQKNYSIKYIIPSDLFKGGYITKELIESNIKYINQ